MAPRRDHVQRLARRIGRRAGLDVIRADFNSPLVDPGALPPAIWDRVSPMPGLELDSQRWRPAWLVR